MSCRAAVLKDEPDWSAAAHLPGALRSLIRRCLKKKPAQRLQHIADARIELDDIAESTEPELTVISAPARLWWRQPMAWLAGAVVGVVAAVAGALMVAPVEEAETHWHPTLLPSENIGGGFNLSADGERLIYVIDTDDGPRLRIRELGAEFGSPVPGTPTTDLTTPVFSADGEEIAYVHANGLWKIPVGGGVATQICECLNGARGADWAPDNTIVVGLPSGRLATVPAVAGGSLSEIALSGVNDPEAANRWPHVLPDGETVLFASSDGDSWDNARIGLVSLRGGEVTFFPGLTGTSPKYLGTRSAGYLVFWRDDRLFAVPFDPDALALRGDPVAVRGEVRINDNTGAAQFSVSESDLVYRTISRQLKELVFFQDGRAESMGAPVDTYGQTAIASRDGSAVLVERGGVRLVDLLGPDLPRQINELPGEWQALSADGSRVVFDARAPGEALTMFVQPTAGGRAERLGLAGVPMDVTSSGLVVFGEAPPRGLKIAPLDGGSEPRALVELPEQGGYVLNAAVSPDDRLLAYVVHRQGRHTVWVTTLDDTDVPVRVSTPAQNAGFPRWHGRDLYFVDWEGGTEYQMMVATIGAEPEPTVVSPARPLFTLAWPLSTDSWKPSPFDVLPDGRIVTTRVVDTEESHLRTGENWLAELQRLVPVR